MNLNERHFLERLGDRIRDLRTDRNLTQQELADLCGLHRTFIGSVERGERNVAILNVRKIAQALRVSVPELFPSADQQHSGAG